MSWGFTDSIGWVAPARPLVKILSIWTKGQFRLSHGYIVQHRETYRYRCVHIEIFYEDGHKWDTHKFIGDCKEGIIVNGVWYPPDWDYEK